MPDFKSIHTQAGLQAMAQAQATGTPINITEMAVGDGNGNPVEVTEEQSGLVRERFRAAINRVYRDPERANKYTAELVIPAALGGFTLREIGLFNDQGVLFAVGNLPETYKPASGEGAFADTIVRFEFLVTNASVVTLQIDPNVTVATQSWITNNITMAALLPGGTTGQLAKKASNQDGDIIWGDPDDLNVTVNTIDEEQTLAAAQLQVDLAVTSTRGLAVYVDGLRLYEGAGAERWQKAPEPDAVTRIILGQSYPAGTKLIAAQNEPTGFAPSPLERSKNLADVESKGEARNNLDIFSRAEARQLAPAGLLGHFARNTPPTGWLKANGAAVSRVAYAELFAAIGTTYGAGDGFNTFSLPDLRGEFLRGWDDGRGVDGGREFGSAQTGSIQSHAHSGSSEDAGNHAHTGSALSAGSHGHSASTGAAGSHSHTQTLYTNESSGSDGLYPADGYGYTKNSAANHAAGQHSHSVSIGLGGTHSHALAIGAAGAHSHAITINAAGEAETRPRNRAMLVCIKF